MQENEGRLTAMVTYSVGTALVWFDLFVHPFSHICNIGQVSYRLQFTTHLTINGQPHNTI